MENRKQESNSILVVDDNQAIRSVLKDLLEMEGHEVLTAANGKEALAILENHYPRVILLDMRMPVMDGWQFRMAQLANEKIAQIPLFVFFAGNKADPKLQEMKPQGLLCKPIDIDNLLNSLQPFLNKH